MKKIFIICLALVATTLTSCQDSAAKKVTNSTTAAATSSAKPSTAGPVMTFDKTVHDFGTINEGDKVTTVFSFTNTGSED